MDSTVQALIDRYQLKPLPLEGTLFAQTYRSTDDASPGRAVGTAMIGLYCAEPKSHSSFHRLTLDEIWHFYGGDPLRLILLKPDGSSEDILIGPDPSKGHHVQFCVPAGVWQAGEMVPGGRYSLYGCTLAPGWFPECFEGGTRSQLLASHPGRASDIDQLACPDGVGAMPHQAIGPSQDRSRHGC